MKKNLSKVLSIVLCLVLLGTMCISAAAAPFDGTGTKKNPYVIRTAADLELLAQSVEAGEDFSGQFIRLENDITVDGSFSPIGSEAAPFKGTFDGNGKTLSGFSVNEDYAGLFGCTSGAVITNVTVQGDFNATNYAGAVAAYATDTVIESCTSAANVYCDEDYAGGIAGYIASGKITDCEITADKVVASYNKYCGGIAGFSGAEIKSCTNNAFILGAQYTGGIAGSSTGDIISCTNITTVSATKSVLGGIAGVTEGSIRYCKNTGAVNDMMTSSVGKAGGIAGVAYGAVIEECHNNGEVSVTGLYVGGIAGYTTETDIVNCLSTAAVKSSSSYAGGIFGMAVDGKTAYCVSTASVSAKNGTAAGIGALSQTEITGCYYNSDKLSVATCSDSSADAKGLASSAFVAEASLSALDFDKIWTVNTSHSASYPLLSSIPFHSVSITSEKAASCTADGSITGTCTHCFEKIETVIPATGHTYSVVSSKAPTCTANGYKDLLCSVCSDTETQELAATGHSDADENSVCDECGANLKEEEKPAEKTFLEKVGDFFRSILNWIKKLFVR